MTPGPGLANDAGGRVIVALDFENHAEALRLCDRLDGRLRWAKVGLELFTAEGPRAVTELVARGLQVFLDLKLHDIPNTVERASERAAALGASLITVHAGGGVEMMAAAVRGAESGAPGGGARPRILAVTVLTSLTGDELPGYYSPIPVPERVSLLARAAAEAGAGGIVASARELTRLRAGFETGFLLVTPGIRFEDEVAGDQKRVATPYAAIRDGADYLVIGRPITRAADPAAAWDRAVADVASALAPRA